MNSSPSNAQRVAEFHRAIQKRLPTVPTVPDADELTFRLTLLTEEMAEVQEAAGELSARLPRAAPADLIPLAHELTDLLYVTYGALQALGIDADAAFAEVHRVNMHKASGPRRADGKQLKPEGWQPADLKRVLGLDDQTGELDR
jgi:predicted HAD superfamily Cof-like phosphohydrolase